MPNELKQRRMLDIAHQHGMEAYPAQTGCGIIVEIPWTHLLGGTGWDTEYVDSFRQLRAVLGY